MPVMHSQNGIHMQQYVCFLAQQVAEKAMTVSNHFFIGDRVEDLYRKHDLLKED